MVQTNQRGFGAVEVLLGLVIVGILGFTGWFVWQSQKETNKAYDDASHSQNAVPKAPDSNAVSEFEKCRKAEGSRLLGTYPEQCVTKDGKTYTAADVTPAATATKNGYLTIKEWGVKIPLTYADKLTYSYDEADKPAGGFLDVSTDSTVSLTMKTEVGGTESCRQLDLKWGRSKQKSSQTDSVGHIGEYYYYVWGDGAPRECGVTENQIQVKTSAEQLQNTFEPTQP